MRTINLDQYSDILIQPVKTLLQTVTESHRVLENIRNLVSLESFTMALIHSPYHHNW
jgi:hypothetical protein